MDISHRYIHQIWSSAVIRQPSRSLPDGVFAYSFQRLTFLVSYYPIVVIVLSISSLSRSEPLRWGRFSFNTVASCTLRHRFCISSAVLHRYYGFIRHLLTHCFCFPIQVILRLPLPLQLSSVTQKRVGY